MKNHFVHTPCGPVQGAAGGADGVSVFRGIRYATAGRWEYPRQVTHWDGVYDAANFGACSFQPRAFYNEEDVPEKAFYYNEFRRGEHYDYSEDCLFLNIWAPDDAKNAPVLFYIHGGGFLGGCGHEKHFDGTAWCKKGVVAVTINYRLGPMGFLCLPELAARDGHTGNYAMFDQMAALPGLTNARVMACNNIRPRTMAFYTFLGYTAERLPHYYRLADKASYAVARVARRDILPAGGSAVLRLLPDEDALRKCGYTPDPARRPYKDLWYLARRYFHYPRQRYDVWAVEECGAVQALLATRCIPVNGTCVLRIVDYTGVPEAFSRLGAAVSRLMADCGAEYADCYCWGIPAQTMAEAGFCARTEDDLNIIPNYLTPPLCENTEYYFFTSEPAAFTMFKADGDQDRPNIRVE